jgi:hypothetical protein
MSTENIPYYVIAAGLTAAVVAGATFPGYYSTAWGIIAGGLTVLGVSMAQAVAYDAGKNDEREGEE